MNNYFNIYAIKISETYKRPMHIVGNKLIDTEAIIRFRETMKDNSNINNEYFLLASGKLVKEYKQNGN